MLHAAEMAAAEMQLLRQALDKLQAETRVLDDELAQAREQSILGELERAELSHELEAMSAKLQASETGRAELEGTISKVEPHSLCQVYTPNNKAYFDAASSCQTVGVVCLRQLSTIFPESNLFPIASVIDVVGAQSSSSQARCDQMYYVFSCATRALSDCA